MIFVFRGKRKAGTLTYVMVSEGPESCEGDVRLRPHGSNSLNRQAAGNRWSGSLVSIHEQKRSHGRALVVRDDTNDLVVNGSVLVYR